MTGWRIGYGAGSEDIIKSIQKIQSQSTTNPTSISQIAAMKALNSEKVFLNDWIIKFKERRDFVVEKFNNIYGLRCFKPEGAFYVFVSCEGLIGKMTPSGEKIVSDLDFASYLLESQGVAVVPGSAFGKSPYFRISYAASMELLVKACDRISKAITGLSEK